MKNSLPRTWLGGLLICLCVGCSSTAPVKQFYTLHSIDKAAASAPLALPGGLGIGPVELPELLTGINIVSMVGEQQVDRSQDHLWAGDLQRAISRVIADNLSQRLALDDVTPYPWDTRHRPQQQVSVLIEALQGELGGDVKLVVKWTLSGQQGADRIHIGRQQFSASTRDASYLSYVAAINSVVNQFSLKLEAEIREHWSALTPSEVGAEVTQEQRR